MPFNQGAKRCSWTLGLRADAAKPGVALTPGAIVVMACFLSVLGNPTPARSQGAAGACPPGWTLVNGRCMVTGKGTYGPAPSAQRQIESIIQGQGSTAAPQNPAPFQGSSLPNLSGKWRVSYDTGSFDLELRQNGNSIDGGATLRGILNGNVLTGTFTDLIGTGPLRLTFGPGGNSFAGDATVRSQVSHLSGVRVVALGQGPEAPQAILRERARVDEVLASGVPPEEQARVACRNLFAATYSAADGTWTTSFKSGSSPTVEPFFPRKNGVTYLQVRNVITPTNSQPLPEKGPDRANAFEFKGSVSFRGTIFRTASDESDWTRWRDIYTVARQFATCNYEIRRGEPSIGAVDELIRLDFSKLNPPSTIPPR